ncbi:hypothetical protein GL417_23285 [Salmonella enterica]|nr:hypothetical protein [Salmonella enterica]
MFTANIETNNTGSVNPMNYATRIFELTVYEKLIKYAREMQGLYLTGDVKQMQNRKLPVDTNGDGTLSTYVGYLNVFYPATSGSRTERTMRLKDDLEKLIDAGFFEIGIGNRGAVTYRLTDLYKTHDVNELLGD